MPPETQPLPFPPPQTLFIELTSHCNMHCRFCPSDLLRRGKCHLDESDLRSFLGQLHDLGLRPPILCNVLGEPLLNKRIFEYLDLFAAAGHAVTLISNMTLLENAETRRRLLGYANLTLALSLQTVSRRSFALRGSPRTSLKKMFAVAHAAVEEKFRHSSRTRLEIHVASGRRQAQDPTVQSDFPLDLCPSFSSPAAEARWIGRYMTRLERLARRIARSHPQHWRSEQERTGLLYREHIGSRIAVNRETIPADFLSLKEDAFWGYMFLPDVFLVFKCFELWAREPSFVRSLLPEGALLYEEEYSGSQACGMTGNLGLLANGDLIFCCLDYEGEMRLGNIRDLALRDLLSSPLRRATLADAMVQPLCRRCRATLFIFDTRPLAAASQVVDKFGRGYYAREADLFGRGGRWSAGLSLAYVYCRIPARRLLLSYHAERTGAEPVRLRIAAWDEAGGCFRAEHEFAFRPEPAADGRITAEHGFTPGRLYRFEITAPTFVPAEVSGNDTRRLGLAIFSISLER